MAKVNFEKRNIITLAFRQEKADPDYGTCLWADFYFDLDSYALSISSDCGDYAYSWTPTPNTESFMDLMRRINKYYLRNKISEESEFMLEESKRDTISNLETYMFDCVEDKGKAEDEINDIDFSNENIFYREVDEILDRYGIVDTFKLIAAVCDYPAGALKIVEIFEKYVQPALAEMVRINDYKNTWRLPWNMRHLRRVNKPTRHLAGRKRRNAKARMEKNLSYGRVQ